MDIQMSVAVGIFVVTYVVMLSEKVHKTVAALLGGSAMLLLRIVSEEDAFAAVDLSVIFLLTGMMIIVHFLAESGFFGFVAIRLAHVARGRPIPLLLLLCTVTAVLSALVDNVTTVLLIAPVTFLITEQLEVSPIPYLILEALASNIGGTATLIGDPPNIIIGSAADLSFNDFLFNLGPVVVVCLAALLLVAIFFIRGQAHVSSEVRARVMEMNASRAIRDRKLLLKTGCVLCAVFVLFLVHEVVHLKPATVALAGAAVILLLTRADPEDAFKAVEWPTLFFFVGLFIMVEGLRGTGVLDKLAELALSMTGNELAPTALVLLWFGAIAAALIGAVPLVTTLIPVVHNIVPVIAEHSAVDAELVGMALWWSLALGACLGGNGTMFGTAANLVVVQIARNNGREISFGRFMAYGLPVMLMTLAICTVYIFFRYIP